MPYLPAAVPMPARYYVVLYHCAVQIGELQPNKFTWTSYANIIFLESPAFVGWSYSNSTQDLAVGEGSRACVASAVAGPVGWHVQRSAWAHAKLVQQLCCAVQ